MADMEKILSSLQLETKNVKKSLDLLQKSFEVDRASWTKGCNLAAGWHSERLAKIAQLEKKLTAEDTIVEGLASAVENITKLHNKLADKVIALENRCYVVDTHGGGV